MECPQDGDSGAFRQGKAASPQRRAGVIGA
jgi:hypothetical protein